MDKNMLIRQWLEAAGTRAVRTTAQAAIGAIGTATLFSSVDWKMVAGTALLSGVLSMLTSMAGLPEVKGNKESGGKGL